MTQDGNQTRRRCDLTLPDSVPTASESGRALLELVERIEAQAAHIEVLEGEVDQAVQQRTHAIERAKRTWESTFDAIVDPLALIDGSYRVCRANRAWAAQAGIDVRAVVGQSCHRALFDRPNPCEGCPVSADRASLVGPGKGGCGEVRCGERVYRVWAYPAAAEAGPGVVVCQYKDITDDMALQHKLAHTEKMAAVGQFAAGVAHEISNPLSAIVAFAQLLRGSAVLAHEEREFIQEIEGSAKRCSSILRGLLDFSRPVKPGRSPIDLRRVVQKSIVLVGHSLRPPTYRLESRLPDAPVMVTGNASELEGVLVNLLINAKGAMPDGGRIAVVLEERPAYAQIAVADDGIGMDEATQARLFERFFTTKPEGVGTGLGLPLSRDIVESHGGWIEVDSALRRGTTFTVCLPWPAAE